MKLQRYTRSSKNLFASKKVSKAILSEHAAVRAGQVGRSGTAGGGRISLIQGVATAPINYCCSRYSRLAEGVVPLPNFTPTRTLGRGVWGRLFALSHANLRRPRLNPSRSARRRPNEIAAKGGLPHTQVQEPSAGRSSAPRPHPAGVPTQAASTRRPRRGQEEQSVCRRIIKNIAITRPKEQPHHETAFMDRICSLHFCARSNSVRVGNAGCKSECTYRH